MKPLSETQKRKLSSNTYKGGQSYSVRTPGFHIVYDILHFQFILRYVFDHTVFSIKFPFVGQRLALAHQCADRVVIHLHIIDDLLILQRCLSYSNNKNKYLMMSVWATKIRCFEPPFLF